MNADRNLLLGVLALQADLINQHQFIEACVLWSSDKNSLILDLMVDRGWIRETDKAHLEYFCGRKLEAHDGDAKASLAVVSDDLRQSLAALDDPDIHQTVADLPKQRHPEHETVIYAPRADERYELKRLHATGGIGRIWVARDRMIDRDVALKDLRPDLCNDEALIARFLREARITGQLEHPGIVPVYELAQRSGTDEAFYAMRFVSGRTLAEAAADFHESRAGAEGATFELTSLLNAFVTVCKTIAFAHSRGIVHRDLKGQNVVLGDFGEVVVLDWGLAKQVSIDEPETEPDLNLGCVQTANSTLTSHGEMLGTPAYMAPEQVTGDLEKINHLTDVYGLGAMLYEILTGRPPFVGSDSTEVLAKIKHDPVKPPTEIWHEIPTVLASVCMRALAKEPSQRFSTANELAQAVEQWQEVERKRAQLALEASEALYHSLVETIPMNVWRKDTEYRFSFANTGFCDATGRTLEELVGKTDFDLYPNALAEKYRRDDAQIMTMGQTIDVVEEHETAAGERISVRVIKLPIRDAEGTIIGTQGIFWDVSDLQRLEEALARTTAELERTRPRTS